jgi:putative oxidoreductase
LRIIVGLLFLEHGTSKYLSLPVSPLTEVAPVSLSGINGNFIAHAPRGFFPLLNAGELAIVYCFVFLYLAVAGGGVWSLDHLRAGPRAAWRTSVR